MLHNRQAPGRDFHKHFSLAPARSDTNPPSNPQSAPAPSPLQDRAQARNATSRAPHLSLIPLTPPAPPRLRPPTSAPLPPLSPPPPPLERLRPPTTAIRADLSDTHERGERGTGRRRRRMPRERPRSTTSPPTPDPSGPVQAYVSSDRRTPEPVSVPVMRSPSAWSERGRPSRCVLSPPSVHRSRHRHCRLTCDPPSALSPWPCRGIAAVAVTVGTWRVEHLIR